MDTRHWDLCQGEYERALVKVAHARDAYWADPSSHRLRLWATAHMEAEGIAECVDAIYAALVPEGTE